MNKEELKQKIINKQAQAISLKSQADELLSQAQSLSVQRLDILEEIQLLLKEYKESKE